jgi:hypothetical protein
LHPSLHPGPKTPAEGRSRYPACRLSVWFSGSAVLGLRLDTEDDFVGHVLAQEAWEVLSFPAVAETDEVYRIEAISGLEGFTRRQGEALHPDREPLETLARIRRTIGEYACRYGAAQDIAICLMAVTGLPAV